MMKRILAFATTKLVDVTCYAAAKTQNRSDDAPEAVTDGGETAATDGEADRTHGRDEAAADDTAPETDAESLLYADDDEFEAAFGDEWPSLPGESLTWLVEEDESETLLIAYDRDSDSDDEFLQTPAHLSPDGESNSAEE